MKTIDTRNSIFLGLFVVFALFVVIAPTTPFTIDDTIYIAMAEAMAERGSLYSNDPLAILNAPAMLESSDLIHRIDGNAVPQYPGGYALLAAPFFMLFGVKGLILMNALSGAASLWLTHLIAIRLYNDRTVARNAVLILGFATFFSGYVFSIWPHVTSLALTLGGSYLTLKIIGERHRIWFALAAGLLFGASVNIRIDGIIPAIAAFFWLRLFARPSDRLSAIALLAGLAPGLLLAALMNFEKFGVFQPFFYGQTSGLAAASRYIPIAIAGTIALMGALAIDVSHQRMKRLLNLRSTTLALGVAGIFLVGFIVADAFILGLAHGTYNLVVDMQAFDPSKIRPGIIKDEFGYWSFWGIPKKALLQSLPFATLLTLPIIDFFRGKNVSANGFSLLMIAGVIAFFSMNAWHGGMTFNMRYFIPALPFIAILSATSLSALLATIEKPGDTLLRSVIAGATSAMVFYFVVPAFSVAWATPAQLYPQLILSLLLAIGLIVFQLKKTSSFLPLILAGMSFGYAGILSAADTAGELGLRYVKAPYDKAYAGAIPPGSLVVTVAEDHLIHASLNGVVLARAQEKEREVIREAMKIYEAEGRCVYIHTPAAMTIINDPRFITLTVPGVPTHQGNILDLYGLPGQRATCDPQ
ncbi:ArnT family glycosyltransferase [Hyphococcus lacteus]|uniref:Glycosyltransferase RgtA/B/C/D-like domain-containing protein n=1 Tax=Hyphococcus lacteus TaxID=3143536 RepID=A0ABV3Z2P7_9PROT